MAVSMIGPKFYAWDRNGSPLAGGKLYTYAARTNVPKDTYQSEDQVTANSNPVILNTEGYANVYLDGAYKMVLKDADENEIWTADPVTAAQASEWDNCQAATYVSATSFSLVGDQTAIFEADRRVRIDNNVATYSYSTIVSSSYAAGNTTVSISGAMVTTGIVNACTSIVGPQSVVPLKVELPDYVAAEFADVANMKTGTAINFGSTVDFSDYVGRKISTTYHNTQSKEGGWVYIVKTSAQAASDGDVVDDVVNITLPDGYIAVAIIDDHINARACGALTVAEAGSEAASEAACDSAFSAINSQGRNYFIPTSKGSFYACTGGVAIPSKVHVYGEGMYTTKIENTSSNQAGNRDDLFTMSDVQGVRMSDMWLDGGETYDNSISNGYGNGLGGRHNIFVQDVDGGTFERLYHTNTYRSPNTQNGADCIYINGDCTQIVCNRITGLNFGRTVVSALGVKQCTITNCFGTSRYEGMPPAIDVEPATGSGGSIQDTREIVIDSNVIWDSTGGIGYTAINNSITTGRVVISNNVVIAEEFCLDCGQGDAGGTTNDMNGVVVSGNYFEHLNNSGKIRGAVNFGRIVNLVFSDNIIKYTAGTFTSEIQSALNFTDCQVAQVSGNIINGGFYAVRLIGSNESNSDIVFDGGDIQPASGQPTAINITGRFTGDNGLTFNNVSISGDIIGDPPSGGGTGSRVKFLGGRVDGDIQLTGDWRRCKVVDIEMTGNVELIEDPANLGVYPTRGSFDRIYDKTNKWRNLVLTGTFSTNDQLLMTYQPYFVGCGLPLPTTSTSVGIEGDVRKSGSYVFHCVNANTWRRATLSTF